MSRFLFELVILWNLRSSIFYLHWWIFKIDMQHFYFVLRLQDKTRSVNFIGHNIKLFCLIISMSLLLSRIFMYFQFHFELIMLLLFFMIYELFTISLFSSYICIALWISMFMLIMIFFFHYVWIVLRFLYAVLFENYASPFPALFWHLKEKMRVKNG